MNVFKALLGICDTPQPEESTWEVKNGEALVDIVSIPQLGKDGGAVYLSGKGLTNPVLILRTGENAYNAYRSKCAHMGRKIDPIPGENKLRCCSIAHSTYDYDGKVLGGLAKDNLVKYETEIKEGKLVIKTC